MAELRLAGDPPITVALKRNRRARRLTLRVCGLDGRVTLTVPPGLPEAAALEFAQAREGWLRDRLGDVAGRVVVDDGTTFPLEGMPTRLRFAPGVAGRTDNEIVAPSAAGALAYLRHLARNRLAEAVDRHGAALGRRASAIVLRDPRSRWGSCSSAGRLMFSWRLILAPPSVLDYVAAHEVAHLAHMDHSPRFWATVAGLCPDHRRDRTWLRGEGASLHRWQFGS